MTEKSEENIFLFVPNIIGYARVILAIISFYFMPTNYIIASICYIVSALLDAVDGHAARYFNQGTKFGAMLDQLTDRCGTMGLVAVLAHLYPKAMFPLLLSMCIDIACHWIYLHSSILQGKQSHKFIDMSENPIMNVYYTNRTVLFLMCFGNEAFFATLYLYHFTPGPLIYGYNFFSLVLYLTGPIMAAKTFISLLHLIVAAKNLAIIDRNERKQNLKKLECIKYIKNIEVVIENKYIRGCAEPATDLDDSISSGDDGAETVVEVGTLEMEVIYLRRLLDEKEKLVREKDVVIRTQGELIESLKEQISILKSSKLNNNPNTPPNGNTPDQNSSIATDRSH